MRVQNYLCNPWKLTRVGVICLPVAIATNPLFMFGWSKEDKASSNDTKSTMLYVVLGIEGISETPNATADFYCQSNTNNRTWTLCAFYVKSSKVNHRQNTQNERARYCEMGREGERMREREWENEREWESKKSIFLKSICSFLEKSSSSTQWFSWN